MTEFFGGVRNVELTRKTVKLTRPPLDAETKAETEVNASSEAKAEAEDQQLPPSFAYQKQFPTDLINHLKAQQKLSYF